MAILDKKISEIYSGRDISSLSDRPNQDGLDGTQLKARFDQLGKEIIPKYNDLIDELNDVVLPLKADKADEQTRITQELARVSAENVRLSSETLRIENEIARNTFVPYSGSTAYQAGNKVSYLGSSYVAKSNTTGNLPTNTTYWLLIAQKGDNTTASDVTFIPTGNLSSTNVQTALAEIVEDRLVVGGKNLFDKSKATIGYTINGSTGVINANQYYFLTDYIKVTPSIPLKIGGNNPANPINLSYYDSNKVFISGSQPAGYNISFVPPVNAVYVRINGRIENIDTYQVELGTESTEYEAYIPYYISSNQKVSDIEVLANMELTDFDIKNIIINSNFTDGITGFSVGGGTGAVSNNVLAVTGNGTNQIVSVGDSQAGVTVIGKKYFATVKVRVTNADCVKLRLVLAGGGVAEQLTPVINQWYTLSLEFTATANRNDSINVQAHYANAASASGKVVEIKQLMAIDLTTSFGLNNEPTQAEMLELIKKYPDSWFKGTQKNLLNLKELYVLHANKIRNIVASGGGSKWEGKTIATFGDSITWYDGQIYNSNHIESGVRAKGYESYMRERLLCTVVNKGYSGFDMTQIFTELNLYDFTGVDAVTITSGANDHRKGITVGTVLPIGSAFNATTYAGALQKSIEKIINTNHNIKVYLMTPIRGWFFEQGTTNVPNPSGIGVISETYVNVMKEIGVLYGIPVCDLYNLIGLNELNRYNVLGDNPLVFTSYLLHPTTQGFERMQNVIVPFLENN